VINPGKLYNQLFQRITEAEPTGNVTHNNDLTKWQVPVSRVVRLPWVKKRHQSQNMPESTK